MLISAAAHHPFVSLKIDGALVFFSTLESGQNTVSRHLFLTLTIAGWCCTLPPQCFKSMTAEKFAERPHPDSSQNINSPEVLPVAEYWVMSAGLDPAGYGTHTMRRTEAMSVYRKTKNLRAVQLLLGHTKLESTVRIWILRLMTP